jgi:hypothetical protein
MTVTGLRPLDKVLIEDPWWGSYGWSLASYHASISEICLNDSVPDNVRQHFENARNAWLYSFFAYHLLSVAVMAAHTAAEAAIRAKADAEGMSGRKKLYDLMGEAITKRWIVDRGFSVTADRAQHWEEHRETLRLIGAPDCGPYEEPTDDQAYSRQLVDAIRQIRNSLAHGETFLTPAVSSIFRTIAEFINQLFPAPE